MAPMVKCLAADLSSMYEAQRIAAVAFYGEVGPIGGGNDLGSGSRCLVTFLGTLSHDRQVGVVTFDTKEMCDV